MTSYHRTYVPRCGNNFTRITPSNFGGRSTFNLATHLVLPSSVSPPSLLRSHFLPSSFPSYLALALISFLTVFLAFHSSTQLTAITAQRFLAGCTTYAAPSFHFHCQVIIFGCG